MLDAFLADLARRPIEWGVDDCSMSIANWWLLNHGIDPAAHLRDTYATEDECFSLVRRSGGLLSLVSGIAAGVGAKETTDFKAGDFAVIGARDMEWGAIRTPTGRWFIRSRNGAAAVTRAFVLKGWSI